MEGLFPDGHREGRKQCKYHLVFIPKCRRKAPSGALRKHLGEVFRKLAELKESRIEEGHLMPDDVHSMISIPPKDPMSQVVGFIKGKSVIQSGIDLAFAAAAYNLASAWNGR